MVDHLAPDWAGELRRLIDNKLAGLEQLRTLPDYAEVTIQVARHRGQWGSVTLTYIDRTSPGPHRR